MVWFLFYINGSVQFLCLETKLNQNRTMPISYSYTLRMFSNNMWCRGEWTKTCMNFVAWKNITKGFVWICPITNYTIFFVWSCMSRIVKKLCFNVLKLKVKIACHIKPNWNLNRFKWRDHFQHVDNHQESYLFTMFRSWSHGLKVNDVGALERLLIFKTTAFTLYNLNQSNLYFNLH